MVNIIKYYKEYVKNWKGLKKIYKEASIIYFIRNGLFMLSGFALYFLLEDTGLLIYLILMIKYHWLSETE